MNNNFEIVEQINMSDLRILALTYNYFQTAKLSLDKTKTIKFIEKINYYLNQKNKEICEDPNNDLNSFYYLDREKKEYILCQWISIYLAQYIPEEVLEISLQQDVLDTINVDRENIKTQIKYIRTSQTKQISTLSMENAQKIVKKYLIEEGCQNISVGYGIPGQKDDKYYSVPVSYDKQTIIIDFESSEENLYKRKLKEQVKK